MIRVRSDIHPRYIRLVKHGENPTTTTHAIDGTTTMTTTHFLAKTTLITSSVATTLSWMVSFVHLTEMVSGLEEKMTHHGRIAEEVIVQVHMLPDISRDIQTTLHSMSWLV